jgi:hypothetical protein
MVVKSRKVRWAGRVIRIHEIWKAYRILVEKPFGNLVGRLQDEVGEQR